MTIQFRNAGAAAPVEVEYVDLSVAASLRDALGGAAFAELAGDTLTQVEKRLADIEAETACGRLEEAGAAAHDLAGLAGAVGLAEIADAAKAMEAACGRGDPRAARKAWAWLAECGRPSLSAARGLFRELS